MSDTILRITGYNEKAQCWVVQTPEGHIFAECPETVYSEGHERAKRLVDSVNNHESLVEALREVLNMYPWSTSVEAKARLLLAELEAGKGGE